MRITKVGFIVNIQFQLVRVGYLLTSHYPTMIVDQIPHAAISKILHHLVCKKVMRKAQFDAANLIQLLPVCFIETKFQTGQIVF